MECVRVRAKYLVAAGLAGSLLFAQGCIATRNWVQEQVDPLSGRVSQTENRMNQAESQIGSLGGRMNGVEGKLDQFEGRFGQLDGRLGQVDSKTERALNSLANLRLERRFVIDMKEGANFATNSASLPMQAKKELDGFLSDLKGDPVVMDSLVFLIAGHTDGQGSEDYNYELGKRRADAVSRYLITQKKMDPLRVVTVSYGKSSPVAENNTSQGRAKNRRVEVFVYRDGVTSTPLIPTTQGEPQTPQREAGEKLSQR